MDRGPVDIQTAGPVAQPFGQRVPEVPAAADEEAQPPSGVRVPGGSFLRVLGQAAGLGVVHGHTGRQFFPQRKR